ncbi:superfamily II DNA or RNA helicase [Desulfosalsimonas propionicica]|uniref:Superfamily II DNA or RNA helicase n=1 Tax=Desulfosalsimonas propionicica TaxID=332175 RepID=A0A7W0HJI3_9BACT|nr:DEAD/DEAH box helicase family protein [Desulfosalsimonas propionicica]MBA2880202.1 superfamily II DNA or RNA helicase [Desulfosalsimonas propionicica]
MTSKPAFGMYDALIDKHLQDVLRQYPELRPVLGKLDAEEQPARYADFVAKVLEQVLREESDPENRLALCNLILEQLSNSPDADTKKLVSTKKSLLLEITPPHYGTSHMPRPHTPVSESSLFTGSPSDPQLVHELAAEMRSADGVDILVSFIKWSGLRLLIPAFEDLRDRNIPVRLITTSYMGASDAPAIEWLAALPNVNVRVSYDTERTRLHAKAYHFRRDSGFSSAYIGSANMSHAAITSGLEWNLKVTAQDMAHILEKFTAEFETYWHSREFVPFDPEDPAPLRSAIRRARHAQPQSAVFFDLRPHPFQERILETLETEREVRGLTRNLVVAATGTGKTVIAAFDFQRFYERKKRQARLLFVAHRVEILTKAQETFRNVLRDAGFGDVLGGTYQAERFDHLFCTVSMLTSRRLWNQVGPGFYDFIIIDEAHHGTASSYRPVFEEFSPEIILGLTATPERMDGGNVLADFDNRFTAEIRLPEALEEKLLCPFHYFGVTDPVSLSDDRFWKNGQYDTHELEKVYTGNHIQARQRLDAILSALHRYEPDMEGVKGIGFCVSIEHAEYMAEMFHKHGLASAAYVSGNHPGHYEPLLNQLKSGQLKFLFTVDKLSEGVDLPDINIVLFLRPTRSLTVFLQQLGRGLRHSPGKDCLTVLDFVGQAHRKYRIDTKIKALLPKHRFSIDREVEQDFPHLPPGCAIQLDRLSRRHVLENIRENLKNLAVQVPERLRAFSHETGQPLTFGNFIRHHDYEPERLLIRETWSTWKAKARLTEFPSDPDITRMKNALIRLALTNGPAEIARLQEIVGLLKTQQVDRAISAAGNTAIMIHYRIWAERGNTLGMNSLRESFDRLSRNPATLSDIEEILAWAESETPVAGIRPDLPLLPAPWSFMPNTDSKTFWLPWARQPLKQPVKGVSASFICRI